MIHHPDDENLHGGPTNEMVNEPHTPEIDPDFDIEGALEEYERRNADGSKDAGNHIGGKI
jgi:hypothetical protein